MPTQARAIEEQYLSLVAEFPLRPLKSDADLDRAVEILNRLLDLGPSRRTEDQEDYMQVLGTLIHEYEQIHWPMPADLEDREVLRRHHEEWLAREREAGPLEDPS